MLPRIYEERLVSILQLILIRKMASFKLIAIILQIYQ